MDTETRRQKAITQKAITKFLTKLEHRIDVIEKRIEVYEKKASSASSAAAAALYVANLGR